jgi:hypothetical protein
MSPEHSNSEPIVDVADSPKEVEKVEPRFEFTIVGPDDPLADEARAVEETAFDEFFENDPEQLEEEYGPYEAASTFLVCRDTESDRVTGVMRFIRNSDAGLKSLNDLETKPWHRPVDEVLRATGLDLDLDKTIDIATFAILPEYRGTNSPEGAFTRAILFHGLCTYTMETGAEAWVTIIDNAARDVVQVWAGAPFHQYQDVLQHAPLAPMPYLGSKSSTPMWATMEEFIPRLRRDNPDIAAAYFDGKGLDYVKRVGAPA